MSLGANQMPAVLQILIFLEATLLSVTGAGTLLLRCIGQRF